MSPYPRRSKSGGRKEGHNRDKQDQVIQTTNGRFVSCVSLCFPCYAQGAEIHEIFGKGKRFSERAHTSLILGLETGQQKDLLLAGTNPQFSRSGHIVFGRERTLWAVPFDLAGLKTIGEPIPVLENVLSKAVGAVTFSLSDEGSLAYMPALGKGTPTWVDRNGQESKWLTTDPGFYAFPRLSPNDRRLAVTNVKDMSLWILEVGERRKTLLTHEGMDLHARWTPDGDRIAFTSSKHGLLNIHWIRSDGSGHAERLATSPNTQYPDSWSPDGRFLVFSEISPDTASDIMLVPIEGDRKPRVLIKSKFNEAVGIVSPDGHWMAYLSDESGQMQVYVTSFPEPDAPRLISEHGGVQPVWGPDGKELFYRIGSEFMAVSIATEPSFKAGTPSLVFAGDYTGPERIYAIYDITSDGQRFVAIKPDQTSVGIHLVQNWFEELKRLVPTDN